MNKRLIAITVSALVFLGAATGCSNAGKLNGV